MKKLLVISALITLTSIVSAQRIELLANMTGSAKAKSTWKTRDSGTQLQAELESEGERLRPNQNYLLTIGTRSWTVRTNALGRYVLDLRFIGPNRPRITVGMKSTLRNSLGLVVVTGTFAPK